MQKMNKKITKLEDHIQTLERNLIILAHRVIEKDEALIENTYRENYTEEERIKQQQLEELVKNLASEYKIDLEQNLSLEEKIEVLYKQIVKVSGKEMFILSLIALIKLVALLFIMSIPVAFAIAIVSGIAAYLLKRYIMNPLTSNEKKIQSLFLLIGIVLAILMITGVLNLPMLFTPLLILASIGLGVLVNKLIQHFNSPQDQLTETLKQLDVAESELAKCLAAERFELAAERFETIIAQATTLTQETQERRNFDSQLLAKISVEQLGSILAAKVESFSSDNPADLGTYITALDNLIRSSWPSTTSQWGEVLKEKLNLLIAHKSKVEDIKSNRESSSLTFNMFLLQETHSIELTTLSQPQSTN